MKSRAAKVKILPYISEYPAINLLSDLKVGYGAASLKLSTEDAAMGLEQIAFWIRKARGVLPVYVKIGGPNARNDIRQLVALGADGLIAPMVESAYGLENFIEAFRTYTTPLQFGTLKKHINVETVTAVRQLDSILAHPLAAELDEITIGCSDLSKSMGLAVTHPEVVRMTEEVTRKTRERGIEVSFGGGVTPSNIDARLARVLPNYFNTRVMTFRYDPAVVYRSAIRKALEFELAMLALDRQEGFLSPEEERSRALELKKRMDSAPL